MKLALSLGILLLVATETDAQPLLGPTVSLHGRTIPTLVLRFDRDTLYLRAWDNTGAPVATLDSSEIVIARGTDTARIVRFERTTKLSSGELALSFVLDNSGSMRHRYDSLTKYLDAFLDSLGGGEVTSAIAFDNIDRRPEYDATSRKRLFLASSGFSVEAGRTKSFWHFFDTIRTMYSPVFDAIWKTFEHIALRRQSGDSLRRDVVIVVTDGDDNCSTTSLADLQEFARALHATIDQVNFHEVTSTRMSWFLQHAGGRLFEAGTLGELHTMIERLCSQLETGYRIVFDFGFGGPSVPRK